MTSSRKRYRCHAMAGTYWLLSYSSRFNQDQTSRHHVMIAKLDPPMPDGEYVAPTCSARFGELWAACRLGTSRSHTNTRFSVMMMRKVAFFARASQPDECGAKGEGCHTKSTHDPPHRKGERGSSIHQPNLDGLSPRSPP
jgi:hypothetical protein